MEFPKRKHLPHEIPLWVNPHNEVYFITINCQERARNQLALPYIGERIFETVRHRQKLSLWWPHVFLLMPDHLHTLISFPPSGKTLVSIIRKWKEWTAKKLRIGWQKDFFEHRVRKNDYGEKSDYILHNPVRKVLVKQPKDWPYVYFGKHDL